MSAGNLIAGLIAPRIGRLINGRPQPSLSDLLGVACDACGADVNGVRTGSADEESNAARDLFMVAARIDGHRDMAIVMACASNLDRLDTVWRRWSTLQGEAASGLATTLLSLRVLARDQCEFRDASRRADAEQRFRSYSDNVKRQTAGRHDDGGAR